MISQRPALDLDVYELTKEHKLMFWNMFKKHHYLGDNFNKGARTWVAYLWGNPVAFNSVLALPHPKIKKAWRGHRLVVLPDYQGMSIGRAMTEFTGELLLSEGKRYFAKTANIKLGEYRNKSANWRGTSKNGIARPDKMSSVKEYNNIHNKALMMRVCYSHEYIGEKE